MTKTGSIDIINRAVDKSHNAWIGRIGLGTISGRTKFRQPNIVDQKPIGINPHSIPLTYVNGMTNLRELYSSISKLSSKKCLSSISALIQKGGQCENCKGYGCIEKITNKESYWLDL